MERGYYLIFRFHLLPNEGDQGRKPPTKEANAQTISANAYMGGWGIAQALAQGADIVLDPDADKVGRYFSSKLVEPALCSIPGFSATAPPGNGTPTIIHWPSTVSGKHITQKVVVGDTETCVDAIEADPIEPPPALHRFTIPEVPNDNLVTVPLGYAFATRSGDKGGNANLGIWGKTPPSACNDRKHLLLKERPGINRQS
jgi:hypothetical protein